MSFVVAIDGPAGSGKGTVTKLVGKKEGLINIDTGAMYRCVTLNMIKEKVGLEDTEKIKEILEKIKIEFKTENEEDKVYLNEEDVTKKIREKDVNELVSQVSHLVEVRENITNLSRKVAEGKKVIMEGRDIGTNVFPNAEIKIYLDATPEERANRRMKQNEEKGISATYEEVLENIKFRDNNDKTSKVAPLKQAEDAVYVDTTNLEIPAVVEKICEIIEDSEKWKNREKEENFEKKNETIDVTNNKNEVEQNKSNEKIDIKKNNVTDLKQNMTKKELKKIKKQEISSKKFDKKEDSIWTKLQRRIVWGFLRGFYKIFYRVKIEGTENVPKEGAFILCGNHIDFMKVPVVVVYCPRKVNFMGKIELFNNPFLARLGKLFDVIPVKRGKQDVDAMKKSLKVLNSKEGLGIFPEGTTKGLEKGVKVKNGAAFMALRTGNPIVPVGVEVTKKPFPKIIVRYGKTLDYSQYKSKTPEKENLDKVTNEMMETIIGLANLHL